jgi:pyruvate kinase
MTNITNKAPNVPVGMFKRTKIIATIGPATSSYADILALIKAGANGIRLNCSHGTLDERDEQIKWIRKASLEYGKPIAIIADLPGPKIRLGEFTGIINVQARKTISFGFNANYEATGVVPTQYDRPRK